MNEVNVLEILEAQVARMAATRRASIDAALLAVEQANRRFDTDALPLMRRIAEIRAMRQKAEAATPKPRTPKDPQAELQRLYERMGLGTD